MSQRPSSRASACSVNCFADVRGKGRATVYDRYTITFSTRVAKCQPPTE